MNIQAKFKNNQIGIENKDLDTFRDLNYYLDITKDHKSSFEDFCIINENGFNVIDESKACPVGYKARAGELLVQTLKKQGIKEIVYVQPRTGFAGISLSYLCKIHNMDLTLVMPSSRRVSDHQALCIEYGAKPLFVRIAAMPVANSYAKKYAQQSSSRKYIKLGLYHDLVIACGVRCIYDYFVNKEKPRVMWSAISTGVLTRTLQIALPDTEFRAVAVARNIQQGELGKAKFYGYHKNFTSISDYVPLGFETEPTYDAKAFDYMNRYGDKGDWFFNVAGIAPEPTINRKDIHSYREWRDLSDLNL
jgi:hypothetical protein